MDLETENSRVTAWHQQDFVVSPNPWSIAQFDGVGAAFNDFASSNYDPLSSKRCEVCVGNSFILNGLYGHCSAPFLDALAFLAISRRLSAVSFSALAMPPARPLATAAGSFSGARSACPVASWTTDQARWEASPLRALRCGTTSSKVGCWFNHTRITRPRSRNIRKKYP
jgi:hypothetical protein